LHAVDISRGVICTYIQDIEVIVSGGCRARENCDDVCWGFCVIFWNYSLSETNHCKVWNSAILFCLIDSSRESQSFIYQL